MTIKKYDTRWWQGTVFTYLWTHHQDVPFHCDGHDEDVTGNKNVWRIKNNLDYVHYCDDCHQIIDLGMVMKPDGRTTCCDAAAVFKGDDRVGTCQACFNPVTR